MKKWVLLFVFGFVFNGYAANDWLDCGQDANGDTANCQYKIDGDGTLTIRGTANNGNIGSWNKDSGVLAPWRNQIVTNVVIEDSIKDLGNNGFRHIRSQNPIEIPSSVVTISARAFGGVGTPEVIIPNSVTSIKASAFAWSDIQKINIPDSVKTIGAEAFRGMSNLTNLVIPDSVTYIGNGAFSSCTKLQTLTIGENTELGKILDYLDDTRSSNLNNLKIYCTGDTSKCDANLAKAGYSDLKSEKSTTKKINGVTYVYDKNGNLVTTSGHRTEKRIYTIGEANVVAGKKNKVMIRYK